MIVSWNLHEIYNHMCFLDLNLLITIDYYWKIDKNYFVLITFILREIIFEFIMPTNGLITARLSVALQKILIEKLNWL